MKYARLLAALGVLCILIAPVLSAQAENGFAKNADSGCKINCNGPMAGSGCPQNCIEFGCQNTNACKLGAQEGTGNQNGNGQNGIQQGAMDGTGPKRDGSCATASA